MEKRYTFKKILVALDGSEHAKHALTVALDIAEKYAVEIVLVSVLHRVYIPIASTWTVSEPTFVAQYLDALKMRHEKVLSDALHKVNLKTPNLMVSTKLEEG